VWTCYPSTESEVSKNFEGISYSGHVVDVYKDPNYSQVTLFKVLLSSMRMMTARS
jgi:hypothetical protein